jgi:ABC-type branched-subunit amino acid transport system substrate-binding protein
MIRKLLPFILVAAAACGDPKLKVGLNVGPAGADVARMASSEVRQSRPARDRRFEIRVAAQIPMVRNELTPALMRAALDSLADDESVAVVVSRFLGQEMLDAAHGYNRKNVPYLAVTPLPPGFASASGPGFSLVPNYTKQATFLASLADPEDRIAIVHIADAYGAMLAAEVVKALTARGLSVTEVRNYEQSWDEPRMVALGTDMRSKDPTLLYFLGRGPSLELVWQPFRDVAKEVRVIGSDLVESNALYVNREGRFTGLQYVRYVDPQSPEPRIKDLHDRYDWWISRGEMTNEAVLVYDAMLLIGEGLRAGARSRADFQQYFASLGRSRPAFEGVGGDIAFGDDGEVAREFELAEVTYRGVEKVDQ